MADEEESNHHHITDSPSPLPLGMRHQSSLEHGGCGEIVEVEGGHIVRSTGKKDRHSKVCTAKGPRDRRVRLSAPTAIQFYDVQDRLGFDRPSKAVDWLIKKAKSAIDDLAELPPWNPADAIRQAAANQPKRSRTVTPPPATGIHGGSGEETEQHQLSFLPESVSTPHYHQPPSSRANAQSQDLRLSLHSFQNGPPFADETEHALFSGQSNPLVFDSSTSSWDPSQKNHRLVTWNNGGAADSPPSGGGGFVFASPATTTSFQPQSQVISQRGSLQSISTPMLRAWFDPYHQHHHHNQSITTNDHHHHHHHYHPYQSAIPGIAFASSGELSGLVVPDRYQSEQDDHGDKPSSDSSDSRP